MRLLTHIAAATAFVVLATLNAGGYRYGAADQAFYIPAILKQLNPARFPRDTALIGPQARYFLVDEIVAGAVRVTGWPMEAWFAGGYVVSLVVLYVALWRLGHSLFLSPLATWALLAAETLRHRITKTGVNTLEGYFHPRVLVFGVGVWAIAEYLRGRAVVALAAVLAAGLLHPTTAAFFLVFLVPAIWVAEPGLRRPLGALVTLGIAGSAWMLLAGPLADGLTPMDAEWRALLSTKDYLFPVQDWRADAWLVNLGTAGLAIGTLAYRVATGHATAPASASAARSREAGLLAGASVLTLGFLITLPAVTAGWSFFVQLQISRVFWLLDLLATVALLWWLVDSPTRSVAPARRRRWAGAVVLGILLLSAARGGWVVLDHRDRPLMSFTLPDDDWSGVLEWARAQPAGVHLLADPGHAWLFGAPLRYAGQDVFLEDVKDTAMAIYARDSAARVIERKAEVADFPGLDAADARALASRYGIDFVIVDRDLSLPLAHQVGRFRVYSLR